MREIKFRGMFAKDGRLNWAYGDLIAHERRCWIISKYSKLHNIDQYSTFVQPHTVGQFTGLYDKHGKEIYEGDVVKDEFGRIMKIGFWNYSLCFIAISKTNFHHADFTEWIINKHYLECEIIGNIHENPELLEQ